MEGDATQQSSTAQTKQILLVTVGAPPKVRLVASSALVVETRPIEALVLPSPPVAAPELVIVDAAAVPFPETALAPFDTHIQSVRDSFPGVPLLVAAEGLRLSARTALLYLGVADCVAPAEVSATPLEQLVQATKERQELVDEINAARVRNVQVQSELDEHRRLHALAVSSVSASSFGMASLRTDFPKKFAELVQTYSELLDVAVGKRIHRAEPDPAHAENLHRFSDELGLLNLSARDVLDVHIHALRAKEEAGVRCDATVHVEEGRFLLLRVLGDLVGFYRRYAFAAVGKARGNDGRE